MSTGLATVMATVENSVSNQCKFDYGEQGPIPHPLIGAERLGLLRGRSEAQRDLLRGLLGNAFYTGQCSVGVLP